MCWSGEASAALAVVGLSSTAYAVYKKEPEVLWVSLGYFSLMEALQAYTYTVINQCSLPSNQISTLLGYLHIAFQPFFINAASMYFINDKVAKKIQLPVYFICFATSIYTLIQLYPFDWAGQCDPRRVMCGKSLCSISGTWHIGWSVPLNGIGNSLMETGIPMIRSGFSGYMIAGFLLPLLYGSWRFTVYHLMFGPTLAGLLSSDHNEQPAVWCLLSIALLLVVVKTPIRKLLFVRDWWLWPKTAMA
ncbi:MAG: DUF5765 domain-containing protein [Alphaproteobacteria bacterium]